MDANFCGHKMLEKTLSNLVILRGSEVFPYLFSQKIWIRTLYFLDRVVYSIIILKSLAEYVSENRLEQTSDYEFTSNIYYKGYSCLGKAKIRIITLVSIPIWVLRKTSLARFDSSTCLKQIYRKRQKCHCDTNKTNCSTDVPWKSARFIQPIILREVYSCKGICILHRLTKPV